MPNILKSATNVTTITIDGKARVGCTLKYTIVVANKAVSSSLWENVIVTDEFSIGLMLNENSVEIDGVAAGSSSEFFSGILAIKIGNLINGESKTTTFKAPIL